jgi:hypothetical protein
MTNPMTTAGDLIRGGTAGAPTRVAVGTTGQVLTVAAGVPVWADAGGPTRSPVAPACVSRWLLADTGATIDDSVGTDDLAYSGAAGQQGRPSPWGACLYTGGLAAGDSPKGAASLEPAAVTILAWVNTFAYAGTEPLIVAKRQDDTTWSGGDPSNAAIAITATASVGIPFAYAICASGIPVATPSGTERRLPLNVWCRVAVSYSVADGMKLYADGQLAASAAQQGAINWGSGSWVIGANNSGSGLVDPQDFEGFVRDVQVCDRVLTPAEILADYQQGLGYAP